MANINPEQFRQEFQQKGFEGVRGMLGKELCKKIETAAAQNRVNVEQYVFSVAAHDSQLFRMLSEARPDTQVQQSRRGTIANLNPFDPVSGGLPKKIGEFDIKRELGRGMMGVVYQGYDAQNERDVAIKMVIAPDPDLFLRFDQERKNLAKLQHPNVVRLYSSGKGPGNLPYFAVEYVEDAQTLEGLIKNLPFTQDRWMRTARTFEQIAAGLGHAHENNVVHRDIKPANILIAKDGTAKVSDFGLAKNTQRVTGLTQDGDILGTIAYMPPEQFEGQQQRVGAHSDVFSLGATLYFALTGKLPFPGSSMYEIGTKLKDPSIKPDAPRSLDKTIPRELEEIALTALNKKPEDRYANGNEFAEALSNYIDGVARGRTVKRAATLGSGVALAVAALASSIVGVQSYRAQKLELAKVNAEKQAQDADLRAAQADVRATQAERATKQERAQTYVNEMRTMITQERFEDARRLYALAIDNASDRASLTKTLSEDKRIIDGTMRVTIDASAGGEWNVDKILPNTFERMYPSSGTEHATRTIELPRGTSYVLEANGYRQPFRVANDMTLRIRRPERMSTRPGDDGWVFVPSSKPAEQDLYFTRWPINQNSYNPATGIPLGMEAMPMSRITPLEAKRFADNYQQAIRREKNDDSWVVRLPTVDELERALAPESGRTYPWGDTLPAARQITPRQGQPLETLLVPTNITYTDPRFAVAPTGIHLSNGTEMATRGDKYFMVGSDPTEPDAKLYGFLRRLNGSPADPVVVREITSNTRSSVLTFRLVAYKQ